MKTKVYIPNPHYIQSINEVEKQDEFKSNNTYYERFGEDKEPRSANTQTPPLDTFEHFQSIPP